MISVVIPTLNASDGLEATLRSLPRALVGEVIVSDGGSTDNTIALARSHGARIVEGAAGRGGQLVRGAAHASGDWLLFLHADTILGTGAEQAMARFMKEGGEAGYFRFRLDDTRIVARILACILECGVALRCGLFGLPYGDQGLLIFRGLYDRLGGYRPLPLMEDVDLVRRIGRRRLRRLEADAVTSAERYRRDGYGARVFRNLSCLCLYWLGVAPDRIKARYDRS
jgi:rSAM/selenodomain-associated transferase 2